MHRIKTEWAGQSGHWGRMRPRYRALVIRLSDGATVYTSERLPSAEEAWEDAARYCAREKLEVAS